MVLRNKESFWGRKRLSKIVFGMGLMCLFGGAPAMVVSATDDVDATPDVYEEPENYDVNDLNLKTNEMGVVEDGATSENDLFDFEAFIKSTDITDGTAPFDKDDAAGNDSGEKNGIVRTFDTVTYPLKITINPKKADKLSNIVLKITGTIDNGITDNRVNAKFAVGGKEDLVNKSVSFKQTYTIAQTGNSVMIPISIETLGAKQGLKLQPHFEVQVVSVDGVDLTKDKIVNVFDELPTITTSAKVSIRSYIQGGLGIYTMSYMPTKSSFTQFADKSNMASFATGFGLAKLPGRTDFKGTTFPSGEIKYNLKMYGTVSWSSGPRKGQSTKLSFDQTDSPTYIIDEQPVGTGVARTGSKNMLVEGQSYNFTYPHLEIPGSKMEDFSEKTIASFRSRYVWDSGEWVLNKAVVNKESVTYEGINKDYVIGSTFPTKRVDGWEGNSPLYGVDDKVFSTNGYVFMMPNEYRIGGKNNKENYENNVYYYATIEMESYIDDNGKEVALTGESSRSIATERNEPIGSFSVEQTMHSYPNGSQLGTPNKSDGFLSKGDVSVILGSDVHAATRFNSSATAYGGYDLITRWNTDSFELTSHYADVGKDHIYSTGYYDENIKQIVRDYTNQKVLYGVPTFTDNSFDSFKLKGQNDYTWYSSYAEAIKKGAVGAMMNSVQTSTGPKSAVNTKIPLHVKSSKIGSLNTNGNANVVFSNLTIYTNEDRKTGVDIHKGRAYTTPSIWNESGDLVTKQSPVGGTANFETLAILNAETSSTIESDKTTYYNSETVNWIAKSSIVLPTTGAPDSYDGSVLVKQTLPKGLDYKVNSGSLAGVAKEPKITKNDDGTTLLTWSLLVSKTGQLENIRFSTTINPFALTSGVQSSLSVKSVISSLLDTRSEHLRTSTAAINVLKVGMVGIYENIDIDYGEKNSTFNIKMKPYTTIEDEMDVKGITIIPLSGDDLGSIYQGSAKLDKITTTSKNPIALYLNNKMVESTDPHDIDLTKNGWYKYTGGTQDITKAVTVLFHVEGVLANTDDVEIGFSVKTKDNNFGNMYLNETVINSATDYKLSPVSNRVRYTIRADAELDLERIRIYTANAKESLPVKVRINKDIIQDRAGTEPIKLSLYEKDTNKKVYEKSYTIGSLQQENDLEIPTAFLKKDTNKSYVVRVDGYNADRIYVKDGADSIDTLGYTASEKTINQKVIDDTELTYKGVIMTEREIGKSVESYYESVTLPLKEQSTLYSGYGLELNQDMEYKNDIGTSSVDAANMAVFLDENVVDAPSQHNLDGLNQINLISEESFSETSLIQTFKYPKVYINRKDGSILSDEQATNSSGSDIVDAGNKVYVPVWLDKLGSYTHIFKNINPLGVNEINISATDSLDVKAYMFGHLDSETMNDDALLLTPNVNHTSDEDPFKDR